MSEIDPEKIESLGPHRFIQSVSGHRLTTDSVLLAEFMPRFGPDDRVVDLGTGTGAILLLLAARSAIGRMVGIESDESSVRLARKNVEINGLKARIEILHADIREVERTWPRGSFTAVVSNPPYIKIGSGRVSPVPERAAARSELTCALPELVRASAHLAGEKGRIFYVYPVSRQAELMAELEVCGLRPARMRFVESKKARVTRVFMVEAGADVEGGVVVEEPVVL